MKLAFGYSNGVPEGVDTAWGCRALVTQDGDVDVLWDRTDAVGSDGERIKLFAYLNNQVGFVWRDRASELLRSRAMSTREGGEHVLFEDDHVVIKGNTNGSAGYLYVCAYPKAGP